MRFRQWILVLGGIGFLPTSTLAVAPPPTLLLQYQFNTPGDVQASNGSDTAPLTGNNGMGTMDFVTGSPIGPSGNPGDLSLDLATSTAPNNYLATTSSAEDTNLDNLKAFTVTAWVSNITATNRAEYIFDQGTGGDSIAFALNASTSAGAEEEEVKIDNGVTKVATFPLSSVSTSWKFVAVTFDTSGNINFYEGSSVAGSALFTSAQSDTNDLPGSPVNFVGIGNTGTTSINQLDGDIDNVRLYNFAQTASGIASVRDEDLPEAGCSVALSLSLLLIGSWRPARRIKHHSARE